MAIALLRIKIRRVIDIVPSAGFYVPLILANAIPATKLPGAI
jgi:hypothetical protein